MNIKRTESPFDLNSELCQGFFAALRKEAREKIGDREQAERDLKKGMDACGRIAFLLARNWDEIAEKHSEDYCHKAKEALGGLMDTIAESLKELPRIYEDETGKGIPEAVPSMAGQAVAGVGDGPAEAAAADD